MPYNGSGTFNAYTPGTPYVTGTVISSTVANNVNSDFSTGLSTAITKNGQTTVTANIPLGGFKLTGLGTGTVATDAANLGQLQNTASNWVVAGGTADVITATYTPAITTLVDGQLVWFRASAANATTTPTFSPNGLTAHTITKNGGAASGAGDIPGINAEVAMRYNLANTRWELIDPAAYVQQGAVSTITSLTNLATINSQAAVWDNAVNDFRLTLTTGLPVTTADVTGATSIFCTPYKGNRIALYSGTVWNTRISAEFSLALGTLTGSLPYDVFCFDNAGVATLEFLAWTNATARATALVYQDGVLVKSGVLTRRYMGTFYTTAATTTEDSAVKRFLWNYYNRVVRQMYRQDQTGSWTYTTATWRQANAAAGNQLDFVRGVAEDMVNIEVSSPVGNTGAGVLVAVAMGLDSTTTPVVTRLSGGYQTATAGNSIISRSTLTAMPTAGRHFYTWLEFSQASGTTTWTTFNGDNLGGIQGSLMA